MSEYYEDIIVNGQVVGSRLVSDYVPEPEPERQLTKYEFLLRFTPTERIAAREGAKTDPYIDDGQHLLAEAQEVMLSDANTIGYVQYLESVGVLAEGRAATILTA